MATADRTTSTFPTDAAGTAAARASFTTPLRAAFVAGGQIKAADLNLLRNACISFNAHTHSVIDYAAIRDFGNSAPGTVIAADPRVSAVMTGGSIPTEVAANALIRATDINTLVTAANAIRNHVHVIFDNPTA